jgi:predicted AAA+ superfamily ATPase
MSARADQEPQQFPIIEPLSSSLSFLSPAVSLRRGLLFSTGRAALSGNLALWEVKKYGNLVILESKKCNNLVTLKVKAYMSALVMSIMREQREAGIPQVFERDLELGEIQPPARGNLVRTIVGVRRCGKTYRLYQEMRRIIESGYSASDILYFNFEDERLKPYDAALLSDVVESFYTLNPNARGEGAFFFFDEIQEVPDWGLFLRRLVDTHKVTIYVSGSSSKMLSREVASEFRGRSLPCEMFPMSFSEYSRYHGNDVSGVPVDQGRKIFTDAEKTHLRHWCERYLEQGGFIAVQKLDVPDSVALLQEYAYRTVNSDVIERYDVRNPVVASRFVSRCIASSGRELSVNKIRNELASQGSSVSRNMLSSLMDYYEEAYLMFPVSEFTRALADNPRSAPKVYAIDQGMFAAFSKASAMERGQRLETAAFLKLRRDRRLVRDGSVARLLFTERSVRHEVDFIVGDVLQQKAYQLIQVSWSLEDPKTRSREISALQAAMRRYDGAESIIVTFDESETIHTEDGVIQVVPAWQWLLDG